MSSMNSCFALICWENKILLFLRDDIPTIPYPNYWHLPGGGSDKGETPEVAMKRELAEEVSHIPKNLKLLGDFTKPNGHNTHIFSAFVDDDEAKLFRLGKGEGQEIRFFTIKEMKKLALTRNIDGYLRNQEELLVQALKTKSLKKLKLEYPALWLPKT